MFPPLSCSRPTPLVFPLRGFGFAPLTKNQRGRASDFPGDRHQQQQAGAATGEIDADNGGNDFSCRGHYQGPGRPPAGPNVSLRPCGVAPSRTRRHGFHTAHTTLVRVTLTRTGANAPDHSGAFFRHLKPPPGIALPADHEPAGPGRDRHVPAGVESALAEQGKNEGTHALWRRRAGMTAVVPTTGGRCRDRWNGSCSLKCYRIRFFPPVSGGLTRSRGFQLLRIVEMCNNYRTKERITGSRSWQSECCFFSDRSQAVG